MIENTNTHDRLFLKTGGIATIIGGVGGLIVNTLHPRPPQRTDELLTLVASMPHWLLIHYGAALAAVATVVGLALLVPTLKDPKARAIGEAGKYVTVLGAATFLVAIMVDGWGFPHFATRWMEASPDQKQMVLWAASAVHTVDAALFPVWAGVFLGLGLLLIAIAVWSSTEYQRLLAAPGILGSLMCLAYALSIVFAVNVPLPLWPWGPAVNTIWMSALGVAMLRKA